MKMTRTRVAIASVLAVAGFAAATADALTLPKWWHSDAVPRRRAASRSVRSWRLWRRWRSTPRGRPSWPVRYSKVRYQGSTAIDYAKRNGDRRLLEALDPRARSL